MKLNMSGRDKRALGILAIAAVVALAFYFWPQDTGAAPVEAAGSIPLAEQRLASVRRLASQAPVEGQQLKQLEEGLRKDEESLIRADTPQQAQAELLQILRGVAGAQQPPIEFSNVDLGQIRAFGDHYGQVMVTVTFGCAIEQLVNLLADLTRQNVAIAPDEIRISTRNEEQKLIEVRLAVAAMVPGEMVPKRRELTAF